MVLKKVKHSQESHAGQRRTPKDKLAPAVAIAVHFSLPLFSPCPDFLLVSLLSLCMVYRCLVCQSFLRYETMNPEAQVGTGGNWLSAFPHTFKLTSQKSLHRTHQLDTFICSSQCGQTEITSFLCFSPSRVVTVQHILGMSGLKTCGWV